jgi:hypothetical protein
MPIADWMVDPPIRALTPFWCLCPAVLEAANPARTHKIHRAARRLHAKEMRIKLAKNTNVNQSCDPRLT